MHDERALQPLELVRVIAEIRGLPEVKEQRLPVLGWLENTASSPPEVVSAYSEALHSGYTIRDGRSKLRLDWAQAALLDRKFGK